MGCKFGKICRKTFPCVRKEPKLHEEEKIQEEPQLKQPKKRTFYRLVRRILRQRRKEKEQCLDKVTEDREAKIPSDPIVLPDLLMVSTDPCLDHGVIIELQKESHPIESMEVSDDGVSEAPCNAIVSVPEFTEIVPFPDCEAIVSVPEPMEFPPQLTVSEDSGDRDHSPEEPTEEPEREDEKCPDPLQSTEDSENTPVEIEEDNISVIELVAIPPTPVVCEECDSKELTPEEFSTTSDSEESDSSVIPPDEFCITSESEESISIIELDVPPTPTVCEESDSSSLPPDECSIISENEESVEMSKLVDNPPTPAVCEETFQIPEVVEVPPTPAVCEEPSATLPVPIEVCPAPEVCESKKAPVEEEATENDHRVKYILVQEAKESIGSPKSAESSKPDPDSSEVTRISSVPEKKERVEEVKAETPAPAPDSSESVKITLDKGQKKEEKKVKDSRPRMQDVRQSRQTVKCVVVREAKQPLDNTKLPDPPKPAPVSLTVRTTVLQEQRKKEIEKKISKNREPTPRRPIRVAAASRKPVPNEPSKAPEGPKHVRASSPGTSGTVPELKPKMTGMKTQVPTARTTQRNISSKATVSKPPVKKDPVKPPEVPKQVPIPSYGIRSTLKGRKDEATDEQVPRGRETTPRKVIPKVVVSKQPETKAVKQLEAPKRRPVASPGRETADKLPAQGLKAKENEGQVSCRTKLPGRLPTPAVTKIQVPKDFSKPRESPKTVPTASSGTSKSVPTRKQKTKGKKRVKRKIRKKDGAKKGVSKKLEEKDSSKTPEAPEQDSSPDVEPLQEQMTQEKEIIEKVLEPVESVEVVPTIPIKEVEKPPELSELPESSDSPSEESSSLRSDLLDEGLENQKKEATAIVPSTTKPILKGASNEIIEKVLEPVESVWVVPTIPEKEEEKPPEPSELPESSERPSEQSSERIENQKKKATAIVPSTTKQILQGASNIVEDDSIDDDSVMEWTYITRVKPLVEERVQLAPNTSFTDFTLDSVLGSGGFGKVYLVKHTATKRMFAMKTLPKEDIGKFGRSNLKMELQILQMVTAEKQHFLTGLSAYFPSEHHMCLVMDYASQGSLLLHLIIGPFSLKATMFYTACIVLGLQFLHNKDIAHRDLKPGNVLLDASGYAKLADFGLSDDLSAYKHGHLSRSFALRLTEARAQDWRDVGLMIYQMLEKDYLGISLQPSMEEFPDSFTPETCGILKGLFDTRTRMRLGASGSGAEEVKKSSFFMNLDWEALSRKEVKPPKNNRVNTHKFLFTTEPASTLDSPEEPLSVEIQKAVQDIYKNLK